MLGFRVPPRIKDFIFQAAKSEGMDASEWLRKVVVEELRKRGVLPLILMSSDLTGEDKDERKGSNGDS